MNPNTNDHPHVSCPVCGCENVKTAVPHREFSGYSIFICANQDCLHGWTDFDDPFISDSHFKTFQPRADRYVDYIAARFGDRFTLAEIGSSGDFYFLRKLNEAKPEAKLFLNDIVDYSNEVPGFINFCKAVEELPAVDILYMCHSLEHVIDINELLNQVKTKCQTILVEVPGNPPPKWDLVRKSEWGTGWHYHFFNENSLPLFFENHDLKVVSLLPSEPPRSYCPYTPAHNLFIHVEA